MNTIFKILVILVVAVIVGGAFYGAVTATSSGSGTSMPERPAGAEQFDHHEGGESGGGSPAEMIKSLAIISIVGALYFNLSKFFSGKKITRQLA